ncbi:hypothetical protein [Chryseobacterium sp. PMSZPI]|uniref:hypothetical protein n=1 Tax=Chryseobacterium sp. PMSZPI TaxID=1033900 RepID=UPI000C3456F2|nr:hypothetical protein [Chryseobacterium sp. PMSZPI]PKF75481.1 hypothetical protein CW752_03925 [Chryseobacterium sp. PMSZPI]
MKKIYITLILSIILFIVSLFFTAVYISNNKGEMPAIDCFLLGWAESDGGFFVWLANPLLFISAIALLMQQVKVSTVLSLLAVCLSLSYLFFGEITVDEAGHQYPILSYGLGYYLWVASCLTLFIGNIIILKPLGKQTDKTI